MAVSTDAEGGRARQGARTLARVAQAARATSCSSANAAAARRPRVRLAGLSGGELAGLAVVERFFWLPAVWRARWPPSALIFRPNLSRFGGIGSGRFSRVPRGVARALALAGPGLLGRFRWAALYTGWGVQPIWLERLSTASGRVHALKHSCIYLGGNTPYGTVCTHIIIIMHACSAAARATGSS
eukprot:SAG22_NODE_214_length_15003_cov_18.466519_4_plen_185_part_00